MRAERLRHTKDIEMVRESGEMTTDRHFTVRARANGLGTVRVAVASPRSLGTAVKRNRARRRIRAAVAAVLRDRASVRGADVLIVARPAAVEVPFDALTDAVARHLGPVLA